MALGDGPPAPHEVVWEDEHLLVVDKPAGVVVHPAAGHESGTLVQALAGRAAGGDAMRPGVVHRLDRDTSGLLVVAKSDAVLRALQAALQARDIDREYVALVEGRPPALTGTIDAPIGRDRRVRTRHSTDTDNPRAAVTHFEITEALPAFTLLRVRLETGRTHQIRAHLLAIGHPVAGDPEYGHAGILDLERQFLHAGRLAFTHPVTGERLELTSPLPPTSPTRSLELDPRAHDDRPVARQVEVLRGVGGEPRRRQEQVPAPPVEPGLVAPDQVDGREVEGRVALVDGELELLRVDQRQHRRDLLRDPCSRTARRRG